MSLRFVLDENFRGPLWNALRRHTVVVDVICVGDDDGPPLATQDPDLLVWAERENRILLTRDKRTMPAHLAAHLSAGRHCPGIMTFSNSVRVRAIVDYVILVAEAGTADDFRDLITYPSV